MRLFFEKRLFDIYEGMKKSNVMKVVMVVVLIFCSMAEKVELDARRAQSPTLDFPSFKIDFDGFSSRDDAEKQMRDVRLGWDSFFEEREKPKFTDRMVNVVKGSGNQLRGKHNEIEGSKNKLIGIDNSIFGDENSLFGLKNSIFGSQNVIAKGNENIIKGE